MICDYYLIVDKISALLFPFPPVSFSMPDIYSIGLGGGSRVRFSPQGVTKVGPDSVGLNIQRDARVFGGQVSTATDLAVASGLAGEIGDSSHLSGLFSKSELERGTAAIRNLLEAAIDRMKTDPGDVTLLLVGGGSVIVPETLRGVGQVLRPPFFSVANAVGAAIARVSGVVDRIEIPGKRTFEDIIEQCKEDAIGKAVDSGADSKSISIAEVTIIQLPVRLYLSPKTFC